MDINRDNYIIWITDFYDGLLSAEEKEGLFNFLELNHDLKEEFDLYTELKLYPEISYRIDKSPLHKSLSDLDPDLNAEEFDLLSTEYGTQEDLEQSAGLVLTPPLLEYPHKDKLKRIPYRLGALRLTIRILSIAASIALIVSLFILLPTRSDLTQTYSSASVLPFNIQKESVNHRLTARLQENRIALRQVHLKEAPPEESVNDNSISSQNRPVALREQAIEIRPAAYSNLVRLTASNNTSQALLLQMQAIDIPLDQPGLSPRQFLAINFRKHLLKESVENSENLKAYEVADVSINGLNKLMGWEMKFEKETDQEGHLMAYTFTSQLFNLDRKTKISDD